MADKDTTTVTPTATPDDSSPKGVGFLGGTAALAAGAGAGMATGAKLLPMAVENHNKKVLDTAAKASTAIAAFEKASPKPEEGTPAAEQWTAKLREVEKTFEPELEKIGNRSAKLAEAAEQGMFKKGMKVAFNGGAKVQAIVASAAVAATLATAFVVKKLRGGSSHADAVDQQRAAAPTGPAMG